MITVNNVSMNFSGQTLFKDVELKFVPGNCYGIIGANGAGKSTLLRIISGELAPTTGSVSMRKEDRMSVLEQDHFKYDAFPVMDTVIMGNRRLYDIMKEKDALYAKPDFSDADGERAAELEGEFAEMNGWDAETEAAQLLNGIGIPTELHYAQMASLDGRQKVKVLLAQALFGHPNIILLDEPTNGLDIDAIDWLENFLIDYPGTVIVVSHDRHFLNNVCTHTVDIDYTENTVYVDGVALDEPYINELMEDLGPESITHAEVPEGSIFVMGDNRNESLDSRSSYVGCIDERDILGKVLLCFMPFTDFGVVK